MKKLNELRRTSGANAADSLARGQSPAAAQDQAMEVPERLRGLAKSRNAAEIALQRIVPDPDQSREAFDEESIDRLVGSLRSRVVLQRPRARWGEEQSRDLPPATVAQALELLDLPTPVQDLVDQGALAPLAACEVGWLGRPEEQVALAEQAVSEKLTRDQVVAAESS